MAYQYYRTVTTNSSLCGASDVYGFPLYVNFTSATLATVANGGLVTNISGYDIIFASDNLGASPLYWDVEYYNPATGQIIAWVNIPVLYHATNTVIYMVYGNSAITTRQNTPSAAWNSNYVGVYHFGNGATLSTSDSTSIGNNISTMTGTVTGTTSPLYGAALFNGISFLSNASPTSLPAGTTARTIECWVKFLNSSVTGSPQGYLCVGGWGANVAAERWNVYTTGATNTLATEVFGTTGASTSFVNNGQWVHYAAILPSGGQLNSMIGYLNGVPFSPTSTSQILNTIGSPLVIGTLPGAPGNGTFIGSIDEYRISNTNRSADYILASYNSQSNSAFATLGTQQTSSPTTTQTSQGVCRIEPYVIGEEYGNYTNTTVVSVINSTTATTMQVADQEYFPLVPFRVLVAYSEIMLVTQTDGAGTWTVIRGLDGTAPLASIVPGNSVDYVMTSSVLTNMRSTMRQTGPAGRPTSAIYGSEKAGDILLPNNSWYTLQRYDGSNWQYYLNGRKMTVPNALTSFVWDNKGTSTISFANGAAVFYDTSLTATGTLKGIYTTAPTTTPYTFTMGFLPQEQSTNNNGFGMAFREATGKLYYFTDRYSSGLNADVQQWNSYSSFNSDLSSTVAIPSWFHGNVTWMRLRNDGSNLYFQWSMNSINWSTYYTIALTAGKTTFMTTSGPTQVGIYYGDAANAVGGTVINWEQGNV